LHWNSQPLFNGCRVLFFTLKFSTKYQLIVLKLSWNPIYTYIVGYKYYIVEENNYP
jgi:hypothetical protein